MNNYLLVVLVVRREYCCDFRFSIILKSSYMHSCGMIKYIIYGFLKATLFYYYQLYTTIMYTACSSSTNDNDIIYLWLRQEMRYFSQGLYFSGIVYIYDVNRIKSSFHVILWIRRRLMYFFTADIYPTSIDHPSHSKNYVQRCHYYYLNSIPISNKYEACYYEHNIIIYM